MSRTGSYPHLITQNLHSMGSILYLKCEKDFIDFTSCLLDVGIRMTTQSNKVGVVSGYAHLITSGD